MADVRRGWRAGRRRLLASVNPGVVPPCRWPAVLEHQHRPADFLIRLVEELEQLRHLRRQRVRETDVVSRISLLPRLRRERNREAAWVGIEVGVVGAAAVEGKRGAVNYTSP